LTVVYVIQITTVILRLAKSLFIFTVRGASCHSVCYRCNYYDRSSSKRSFFCIEEKTLYRL